MSNNLALVAAYFSFHDLPAIFKFSECEVSVQGSQIVSEIASRVSTFPPLHPTTQF